MAMTAPLSVEQKKVSFPGKHPSDVIESRPWKIRLFRLRLLSGLFWLAWKMTGSPIRAFRVLRAIQEKYQKIFGGAMAGKVACIDDKYYWNIGGAGLPSEALIQFWEREIQGILENRPPLGLRNVFFAITKKCAYHCAHCFEWENLNKPETLSQKDIKDIIQHFQDYGAAQFILSGGEPLLRFKDILAVLQSARPDSDFRIFTSGFSLTQEKAIQLKSVGLTGMTISLDHWQPDLHDAFRGFPGAFEAAEAATRYANDAGLVTGLSVCVTRSFCTRENLQAYLELARSWGVAFVQWLEPMPVGHFQGKDVLLGQEELKLLEDFYLTYNQDPKLRSYPIIEYQGYMQRRVGCFGAGNRYLYIDTDGDVHRCPFCQDKIARALEFPVGDMIGLLQGQGCGLSKLQGRQ
jgi:MoaA/NifB/PqqE/SkfB family radical SAM enzyme